MDPVDYMPAFGSFYPLLYTSTYAGTGCWHASIFNHDHPLFHGDLMPPPNASSLKQGPNFGLMKGQWWAS